MLLTIITDYAILRTQKVIEMKIFNTENNQEVVYVQRHDIHQLISQDIPFPGAIYNEIIERGVIIIDNSDCDDFIRYSNPQVIEFFKNQDWLVDYKTARYLNEEKLMIMGKNAIDQANTLAVTYNETDINDREKRGKLLAKRGLALYYAKSIAEIFWLKQGKKNLPFPIVCDCDGYQMTSTINGDEFTLAETIDPHAYVIYRKDGKMICELDEYPMDLIKTGLDTSIKNKMEHNFFLTDYEPQMNISGDGQYLLISYKPLKKSPKEVYKGFIHRLFKSNKQDINQ